MKRTNYQEIISHSGILGMKWGVRRYQNEDGTLTEEGKKRYGKYSKDYLTFAKNKGKSTKEMSNEELKNFNKRMQMEQDYNRLKANSSALSKGATYVAAASSIIFAVTNLDNAISLGKTVVNRLLRH